MMAQVNCICSAKLAFQKNYLPDKTKNYDEYANVVLLHV